ncbi:unnamed protein product [Ectocarpus sp. 12 AP-2014]
MQTRRRLQQNCCCWQSSSSLLLLCATLKPAPISVGTRFFLKSARRFQTASFKRAVSAWFYGRHKNKQRKRYNREGTIRPGTLDGVDLKRTWTYLVVQLEGN